MAAQDLASEERTALKAYRRAARQVRDRTAIDEGFIINVNFHTAPGEGGFVYFQGLSFDLVPDENFRALLTAVRLTYMSNEPSHFDRACNILWRHGDEGVRDPVSEVRARWDAVLRTGTEVEVRSEGGASRKLGPKELFDAWLYGEVFHLDKDKEADLAIIKASGELGMYGVQGIALGLAGPILDLDDIIADFLDEEPMPRITPKDADSN